MKKKILVLISVAFFVVVPIIGFILFLNQTRSIPDTDIYIEMKLISNDDRSIKIAPESLDELNKIISKTMVINDKDKIMEIFDKDRSKYIELITIIAILLSVFSLFTFINSFIDKTEFDKLKSELIENNRKYEIELKEIKWRNIISAMHRQSKAYRENSRLIFKDTTIVDNTEKMMKFVSWGISYHINMIIEDKLFNKSRANSFSIIIGNIIMGATLYAKMHGYIESVVYTTKDNPILREIINQLYTKFDTNDYELIKSKLLATFPDEINLGEY